MKPRVGMGVLLGLVTALGGPRPAVSEASEPPRFVPSLRPGVPTTVTLARDGSVTLALPGGMVPPDAGDAAAAPLTWRFGLPDRPPETMELLGGRLPIHTSTWLEGGILYTQTVFLTTLEAASPAGGVEVLMLQLAGENTGSEYTNARVCLQAWSGGGALPLRLESGLVWQDGPGSRHLLAAVDAPAEGIESAEGDGLRFRGHMPPGTSGSMAVKIPLGRIEGVPAAEAVGGLEFDVELRKVRRVWERRLPLPRRPPSWSPR